MGDLRVDLLDINNRYPTTDSNFGSQIHHFDNRNEYVACIHAEMNRCRQIDLFLSSADRDVIDQLPLFGHIYFHIYCPTPDSVLEIRRLLPQRERIQVFEELYLWIHIGYTISGHDLLRLPETNDRNQGFASVSRTLQTLLDEVEAAKAGVQPTETNM
jgi:hypothetical protein